MGRMAYEKRENALSERLMRALDNKEYAKKALQAVLADKELEKELPKRVYLKIISNAL